MVDYWTVLWTALITFGATYSAYWLAGKPRLIAFSPSSTNFQLQPAQAGQQPIFIRAGQVTVQNSGRKSASRVQFTAQLGPEPMGYNIVPNVDHAVRQGTRGEWILELEYLGPGEVVTVQILNGPPIDTVRSQEGPAKVVPVVHQRVFPRWINVTALLLILVGLVTVGYGIYAAASWLVTLPR